MELGCARRVCVGWGCVGVVGGLGGPTATHDLI